MPFKSKAQMKAAFGGYLGKEMKQKARQWASETPNIKKLPMKKKPKEGSKKEEKGESKRKEMIEMRKMHKSKIRSAAQMMMGGKY